MDERNAACKRYKEYKCYTWTAGFFAACAGVAIIVCGVVIVKPVVETNSLEFKETTCTTTKGYLTGKSIGCSCGKNCNSEYPCLRILVSYAVDSTTHSGVLFDTEQRLNSDGHKSSEYQCATAPCARGRGDNYRSVVSFNKTHEEGETYKCLYNPAKNEQVLLKRLFTWDAMFHSMLWPCIFFFIFGAITVFLLIQCMKAGDAVSNAPIVTAPGAQPGHFLPPSGGQPGHFLPPSGTQPGQFQPPPPYPGGQAPYPQTLQMQPQPQDPYKTVYSDPINNKNNIGFTYN